MSYLARITECEHGEVDVHWVNPRSAPKRCPGGTTTRIEPDYEAAKKQFEEEFPCHCHDAYLDRGRHGPDCYFDEAEDVAPRIVDAALGGTE
jgi:hypothetical protein